MKNVVELASASEDLLGYATEMSKRASALESNAVQNKQNASEMIESILATLKQAIEDSKSVDRVNDLTGEILSISSQTINNMVTVAVKELIKNSDELVNYINERVLPDYDSLVDSGKQYNEDAMHVNEVVEQFNGMAANLNSLIQFITQAIDDISSAVEESANGVSTAALNTGDLVRDINLISNEMESNSEVAGQLKEESSIFISL